MKVFNRDWAKMDGRILIDGEISMDGDTMKDVKGMVKRDFQDSQLALCWLSLSECDLEALDQCWEACSDSKSWHSSKGTLHGLYKCPLNVVVQQELRIQLPTIWVHFMYQYYFERQRLFNQFSWNNNQWWWCSWAVSKIFKPFIIH